MKKIEIVVVSRLVLIVLIKSFCHSKPTEFFKSILAIVFFFYEILIKNGYDRSIVSPVLKFCIFIVFETI